jgi:hypothetical protein
LVTIYGINLEIVSIVIYIGKVIGNVYHIVKSRRIKMPMKWCREGFTWES